MRKASTELSQSRGLKRRPLLRTSSPLNPKNQPRTYIRIGTANGGTSVYPDLTPNRANQFPIMVRTCDKCTYSIPNARIYLIDDRFNNSTPPIYQGNVDPNFALLIPNLAIMPIHGKESAYRITVLARNKPTYETLKVRFNAQSQQWEATWRIVRETKRPRYNPKNRMAEGQEFKILEDSVWQGGGVTPRNPSTIKVIH